ncbi:putative DNA (cytosine-5-)-methyltransferase [Corynebacterium lipophiloflavum DSM 44291]|uniref:DNA (Cytosine-5-)-methyltransferase n=2 Tax=Corynebacterium lipophiloflavum TaxID=161889 RepID=C0XPW0_CORLD|nr:putative DNA (cytosine-5-)-methyltransferase [Corynebacterium lipophiloflavum DSM 44291]
MAKHYVKGHDLIHVYSKSDKESAPRLSRPKVVQGHVVSRDGRDYLRDDDVLRKKFGKYDKGVERRCLYEEILEYHSEAKKREIDRRIEAGELVLEPFRDTGRHVIVEYKPIDEMSSALYSLLPIVQYLPDGRLDELGLSRHFTYPKPVELVKTLIRSVTPKGDRPLVMDFFSGSATTADAVMQLNSEDDGDRRCISVQIPETVDADFEDRHVFATVDAVGRERIKRAADNIRNDSQFDVDYGFKLFRLEKPSAKTLDQLQSFDPNEDGVLLAGDFVSKFASNGTPGSQVALSTWLVQDGFGLTPTVNAVELDEYKLQVCEDSGYVIEPGLDSDDVMALVDKLEAGELDLKRLVVFGYSVPFSVMHELRQNLKSLRSGQVVSVIERY